VFHNFESTTAHASMQRLPPSSTRQHNFLPAPSLRPPRKISAGALEKTQSSTSTKCLMMPGAAWRAPGAPPPARSVATTTRFRPTSQPDLRPQGVATPKERSSVACWDTPRVVLCRLVLGRAASSSYLALYMD